MTTSEYLWEYRVRYIIRQGLWEPWTEWTDSWGDETYTTKEAASKFADYATYREPIVLGERIYCIVDCGRELVEMRPRE